VKCAIPPRPQLFGQAECFRERQCAGIFFAIIDTTALLRNAVTGQG
jgi:hypothetical protein